MKKAKAKELTRHDTQGECVSHPDHGAVWALSSGRLWCPHQTHDTDKGGTPWVDEQIAERTPCEHGHLGKACTTCFPITADEAGVDIEPEAVTA
jgi:hypothetical protein